MNHIMPVVLLLSITACVDNQNEQPGSATADTINASVKRPAYHATDTFYTIASTDTIILDKYVLHFEKTDSVSFPPYHDNDPVTDSLWESYGHSADLLEKAAISKHSNFVSATDSAIWVKLLNGKTLKLNRYGNTIDDSWCYFETYLQQSNCVLIHVYYMEGDEYILINRENGFTTSIYGKPYFAPGNNSFITIYMDIDAGFSFNGLEYYTIEVDTAIIKTYCEDISVDTFRHWTDYTKLKITRQ